MKSLVSLVLILSAPVTAQEPPPGDGPRGSSQIAAGEARFDVVGRADVAQMPGIFVIARGLPAGGYAEVTALDTGRTIVANVADGEVAEGRVAMLSVDAAAVLGGATGGVRVRRVVALAQDIAQLRAGRAGEPRPDAPPALLAALRKKLPATPVPATPPASERKSAATSRKPAAVRPASAEPVVAPGAVVRSGYSVQVAAVSSADRAMTLARALGGAVIAGPPVWRVRLGPYPTLPAAERAKADAARRGYAGATIVRFP
ncbi:hypothetical protein ASE86_08795 [Sphingomonas sp. Leaf33]|uniref:SPOR domain-containing protein n=1 Tax=Sphingomonas sp. Leaf33 TaxID=1736215 RepID=UPI0006FF66AB|nr:SPOR domain-containing protein [Sphingomonas sp. Leaf33]KQN26228.1 hypothetical protein ASE86_08795 [Sphingomonas sp. Leaf33]